MSKKKVGFLCILAYLSVLPNYQLTAQVWNKIIPGKNNKVITKSASDRYVPTEDEVAKIKNDVLYLSSPKLEGRLPGSQGEVLAGTYIERRMANIGLTPINRSYRKHFKYEWGKDITPEVRFTISGKHLFMPEDAFPFSFSAIGSDENFVLPDSREPHAPWLISLYNSRQDAENRDFDWENEAYKKAKEAQERGASSVIFYDEFGGGAAPKYNKISKHETLEIPVIFVNKGKYEELIKNMRIMQHLYINIAFRKEYKNATNIVGFINNSAPHTVIISAHYDHLGMFNQESPNKNDVLLPGADANSSGVALMLNLAEKLIKSSYKKYNYLFIAFSATEFGIQGSKAFVQDKQFKSELIAYVINLDMVGRLNAKRELFLGGLYSSNTWINQIRPLSNGIKAVYDQPQYLSSDHVTFLKEKIPSLHLFTGMHEDYHKSTDLFHKLNFPGIAMISDYAFQIIAKLDKLSKPAFQDIGSVEIAVQHEDNDSELIGLGIIPDYDYDGNGVLINEVVQGKPAFQAGIKSGDIILQIDGKLVSDYKKVKELLNQFQKGANLKFKIKREATVQEFSMVYF